jgi:hypothetical protein
LRKLAGSMAIVVGKRPALSRLLSIALGADFM